MWTMWPGGGADRSDLDRPVEQRFPPIGVIISGLMSLDDFFANNERVDMFQTLTFHNTLNGQLARHLRTALAQCPTLLSQERPRAFVECQLDADRLTETLLQKKKAYLERLDGLEVASSGKTTRGKRGVFGHQLFGE